MLIASVGRALRSRLSPRLPRPVILMYHRVASVACDPWALGVDPRYFEEQIAYIREHRTPLAMDDVVARLAADTLPANAVAVTFDDGYRDNLINAKPILSKYSIPATVFIATGYLDRESLFWWDELTAMILEAHDPSRLVVSCSGEAIALEWGSPERADLDPHWRVSKGPHTDRQRCYMTLWKKLKHATSEERSRVMTALRACFKARPEPLAMPMSRQDVRELLSDELLQLGAHSVDHSTLTSLSQAECRREIAESAKVCRDLSGRPANGFAYPYGDMNSQAREDVRLAGFAWACSTEGRFLDGEAMDAFALPRIAATNVPPRQLSAFSR